MKKDKNLKKEDLKGAVKFLKHFMTLSYTEKVKIINKLEKRVNK